MVKSAPMLSRRQTPSPARRASGPVLSRPGVTKCCERPMLPDRFLIAD
jgi:hypothetical protein